MRHVHDLPGRVELPLERGRPHGIGHHLARDAHGLLPGHPEHLDLVGLAVRSVWKVKKRAHLKCLCTLKKVQVTGCYCCIRKRRRRMRQNQVYLFFGRFTNNNKYAFLVSFTANFCPEEKKRKLEKKLALNPLLRRQKLLKAEADG